MTVTPPPPTLGQTPTPPRTKNRKTRTGKAHSKVPPSHWTKPTARKVTTSLPPLHYNRGPFTFEFEDYRWRFWAIRGDVRDAIVMTEIETATWDDSSAVMTGSITYRFPTWADKLGLKEGHQIRAEFSDDEGANWTPAWTMRLDAPNSDLAARERTANVVNELNRLLQSDDDFVYAKGKHKPSGWRVDQVIRDICHKYGIVIAHLPVMKTRITNWHLTNQRPLDVIHSALIREKNNTGRRYAISLDWRDRLHVTPFRRPTALLEVGPQLIAATGSGVHDSRFATALTVRTGVPLNTTTDAKGHRKARVRKLAVAVKSPSGIRLYGYIHRNLYSPDANSHADLRHEGKLFLAAIAKPKRSFTVTLPGTPWIRRLDAFKMVLPTEGINQICYVADARHNLDGATGYTTEIVLDFDDPFVDNKSDLILSKLSDVAISRSRKDPTGGKKKKKKKKSPTQQAHTQAPPSLGRTPTPAQTTHRHGAPQATRR